MQTRDNPHDDDRKPDTLIESKLSIPFERRRTPRRPVNGHAMAVFSAVASAGQLVRVELHDSSYTGMGVKSPMKVGPGTGVSILPEHAMSPRQVGIVVRCETRDDMYFLGVQCKAAKAAA